MSNDATTTAAWAAGVIGVEARRQGSTERDVGVPDEERHDEDRDVDDDRIEDVAAEAPPPAGELRRT